MQRILRQRRGHASDRMSGIFPESINPCRLRRIQVRAGAVYTVSSTRFYTEDVLGSTKAFTQQEAEGYPKAPSCILKKVVYSPNMFNKVLEEVETLLTQPHLHVDAGIANLQQVCFRGTHFVVGQVPRVAITIQSGRASTASTLRLSSRSTP